MWPPSVFGMSSSTYHDPSFMLSGGFRLFGICGMLVKIPVRHQGKNCIFLRRAHGFEQTPFRIGFSLGTHSSKLTEAMQIECLCHGHSMLIPLMIEPHLVLIILLSRLELSR